MGTESTTEGLGSLPFAQSYTSSLVRYEQPDSSIRFGFGQSDNWVRLVRVVVVQRGSTSECSVWVRFNSDL